MKSGMEMMLDSMGIQTGAVKQLLDPENIKALLTKIEKMYTTIDEIYAAVLRVEIKLETIPTEKAMGLLSDGLEQAERDVEEYVRNFNNESDSATCN